MIKSLITTCCLAGALALRAGSPVAVEVEQGACHPVLSPDGNKLLYTTVDHTGLKALDLVSGAVSVIDSEVAAGFQPAFSADGSTVYYRTASMNDRLIYRDVRSYSFRDGQNRRMQAPGRGNESAAAFAPGVSAWAEYRTIAVQRDGKRVEISPLADAHSYLWASLSVDASRIAFCEPFSGVYVCNADGSEAVRLLAKGDYVSWAGPNTVVAVVSEDDGYGILLSQLVAVNTATGIVRALTPDSVLVSEATAAQDGTVVYTDHEGRMFKFNIND
ncbi:MAG: hypothetical protein K2M19_05175 [Muribaculaceae bacterium]|nr:hypothetical protein [Muribaculaceae bacterium]